MDPATGTRKGGAMIHPYGSMTPKLHPGVFTVPSAEIIGDVVIGRDSSVWYNTVIRGDVNSIRIGERTNVQDGSILHVRHEVYPLVVGSDVTIGHGAILHACTVEDHCLIGMGAIVLDDAIIREYTLVAAGAMVREHSRFPGGVLLAGVPARVVRDITDAERTMIRDSAVNYLEYVQKYRATPTGGIA
jgi:gamma-carbonic anhydrase